jgi:diacylglycerol kinase (ATP)
MRITLIYNPGAGDGKNDMSELSSRIESAGHEVTCYSSKCKNWTEALDLLDHPADLIAVAGGDGTVGRIAKRLVGRGIPLAVLPLGTANNVARTLDLTDLSLDEWIAAWPTARRLAMDVGIASGPWGSLRFLEGVGAGLFAWTVPRARAAPDARSDPERKLRDGLQRLKERLESCQATRIEAELDGRDISGEYLMLEALNTPFVGPNLFLGHQGSICDGKLLLTLVPEAERAHLRAQLSGWQRGLLCQPELPTCSGRQLRIEWTGFKLHIDDKFWPKDGESYAPLPATIEVRLEQGALQVLVPPDYSENSPRMSSVSCPIDGTAANAAASQSH